MLNNGRRLSVYGAAGILIAIVIIACFIIGNTYLQPSSQGNDAGIGTGKLTILITDKPVKLKNLTITIDWVKIKDQNENWHNLELKGNAENVTFDLLKLQNVSDTLSETEIPAGNYTMIQMHVLKANATYLDDTWDLLKVPSEVIKVLLKPHLELESGGQITVLIDLQPDDLQTIAISKSLNLRPVVKAIVSQSQD